MKKRKPLRHYAWAAARLALTIPLFVFGLLGVIFYMAYERCLDEGQGDEL